MIPEGTIKGYLDMLLCSSDPGADLHQLCWVTAEPDDYSPLGLPDPDTLQCTVYAIAPTGDVDAVQFINHTIRYATKQARRAGLTVLFAGLAVEAHTVMRDGTEVTENLARRLGADGKLHEHPSAVELTLLYAVCADGRRWSGERILTGPEAGLTEGPTTHVGRLVPDEECAMHQRLLRAAVGLNLPPGEARR